jgi:hypothetical protein
MVDTQSDGSVLARLATASDRRQRPVATMDTGASLFFDHRDPVMVSWLNSRRDT